MKNIKLNGKTYLEVSNVELPTVEGGKTQFYDPADIPAPEFTVEFRDIDGTLIKSVGANKGDSVALPSEIPNFDSEYLEFEEWQADGDLNNIEHDTLALPIYQTRVNSEGKRPTILKCYFDETQLTAKLQIGRSYPRNCKIDWGDGTIESLTTETPEHIYSSKGLYIIKIWGDTYSIGSNLYGNGMFNDRILVDCAVSVYIGNDVTKLESNCFKENHSIKVITIPKTVTSIDSECFYNIDNIKAISLPDTTILNNTYSIFYGCNNLRYLIISKQQLILGDFIKSCSSIEHFIIPDSVTTIGKISLLGVPSIVLSNNISSIKDITVRDELIINDNINSYDLKYYSSSMYNISLPNNADANMSLKAPLSDSCLIDIATKLKDNTGLTAKTITFNKRTSYAICNVLKIGDKSLLQYMQDKNWTVSFS